MIGHRVVVTGLGAVTPLGNDLTSSWENLIAGKSGIGPVTRFDTSDHQTTFAGEVKDFDAEPFVPAKQAKRMELFTLYAVACAKMALADANWEIPEEERARVGAIIGCGLGGLESIETYHEKLLKQGPRRISPFFIPIIIGNMAAGQVAIFTGAMGPNLATTSACASGMHGVGYAYSEIKLGRADAMICGGTESVITPMCFAGFNALKALSTRNDDPQRASRPFDRDREGFVVGEGCGLLLIESLEHATARGARIYAEIVGFGASGDAYHMTAPEESGAGMALAMEAAVREAEISPEEVDCINAHGTSTQLNDLTETRAIKRVFGAHARNIPVSANKSQIGHLLGAAGGVECVFSTKTIHEGIIPGTINQENPDPECDLDYVGDGSRKQQVEYVLSNSFGFGGTNACVLFKRFEE
ncbi:MAG: beta-ketoacyl-ACP synthase II [Desulfovibrionales bacterium]